MILHLVLVFVACFVWIGLRQLQNLQSVRQKYWMMVPTSLMIEAAGVYYVVTVAHMIDAWWLFVVTGLGGGTGTMFFTWLAHRGKK